MDEQPDIEQQQLLVRVAELQLLLARNQLLPEQSLKTLDQINGLGQHVATRPAVMLSRTLKRLEPLARRPQRVACRREFRTMTRVS